MFMWSVLGRTADRNNGEERATDLIIAQHIESVVNQELPAANHTLKVCKNNFFTSSRKF